MHKILAVDTTHGVCSVAILADGKITAEITDPENGKQAERLLAIIEQCLKDSGITYNGLDAIAVNIGPGSFTGVRIGMAAVNGLKLVNKTPLVAVTSFEAVAWSLMNEQKVLVAFDARRRQVFAQLFGKGGLPLSQGLLLTYDDIVNIAPDEEFILTGNGSDLVKNQLKNHNFKFEVKYPDAVSESSDIAFVAFNKLKNNDFSDSVSPLYIRSPDAKKSSV